MGQVQRPSVMQKCSSVFVNIFYPRAILLSHVTAISLWGISVMSCYSQV